MNQHTVSFSDIARKQLTAIGENINMNAPQDPDDTWQADTSLLARKTVNRLLSETGYSTTTEAVGDVQQVIRALNREGNISLREAVKSAEQEGTTFTTLKLELEKLEQFYAGPSKAEPSQTAVLPR